MADFVIVIAAAAIGMAAPAPATVDPAAGASVPMNAPTVGFRTYPDAEACEKATQGLTAPVGRRLVCLPVERSLGDLTNAY